MRDLKHLKAIETLVRFIETQALSDMHASQRARPELDAMAAEDCTTLDVMVRGLLIGATVSILIDNLDWPFEAKLACREFLAAQGQKDMKWMAALRRRQKTLN